MQLEPLAETTGLLVAYDHANHWLYADWHGDHTQETSRAACLVLLDALRQHPTTKILNDNSRILSTSVELSEWGAWWLSEMRAAGLAYLAWVYPRNFTSREATDAILSRIQQPVLAAFDDVASAYFWLKAQ
ncbi:hypothetical protein [Hymenobacter sp. BRD67]|uniref:hypothetical protein n=1 Tax=Hymenobacter sp. BRD67 TaxID=2675877 RepID=UPI0015678019|nr:hypothetical protein [Hymenobacter sp. BRD67]QKG53248.1 hypothetical protein GKZ67_12435 [Hymenobacter sp. BRD67]